MKLTCNRQCLSAFSRQTQVQCDGSCAKMWSTPKHKREARLFQGRFLETVRKLKKLEKEGGAK